MQPLSDPADTPLASHTNEFERVQDAQSTQTVQEIQHLDDDLVATDTGIHMRSKPSPLRSPVWDTWRTLSSDLNDSDLAPDFNSYHDIGERSIGQHNSVIESQPKPSSPAYENNLQTKERGSKLNNEETFTQLLSLFRINSDLSFLDNSDDENLSVSVELMETADSIVDLSSKASASKPLETSTIFESQEQYNDKILKLMEQNCSPGLMLALQDGSFQPSEKTGLEAGHLVQTIFQKVKKPQRAKDLLLLPPPFFKQSNRKRRMKANVVTSNKFLEEEEKVQKEKDEQKFSKKMRMDFFQQKRQDLDEVLLSLSEKRLELTKLKTFRIKGKKKADGQDNELKIKNIQEEIKNLMIKQKLLKAKKLNKSDE